MKMIIPDPIFFHPGSRFQTFPTPLINFAPPPPCCWKRWVKNVRKQGHNISVRFCIRTCWCGRPLCPTSQARRRGWRSLQQWSHSQLRGRVAGLKKNRKYIRFYPGCLSPNPDPNFSHPKSRIRIKEFKYFNHETLFLSSQKYYPSSSFQILT